MSHFLTGFFAFVVLAILAVALWALSFPLLSLISKSPDWRDPLAVLGVLLALLTLAPLMWAVLRFRAAAADQRRAKQYAAWGVVLPTRGILGGPACKDGMQELVKDRVSLAGLQLSGQKPGRGAQLAGVILPGANLSRAGLRYASLWKANLERANLAFADLRGANLSSVPDSIAEVAGLPQDSQLDLGETAQGANLRKAILTGAKLDDANLSNVDLRGARLDLVSFRGADLSGANLMGTQGLSTVDWTDAKLKGANLPSDVFVPGSVHEED